jgi:hypothetical protein
MPQGPADGQILRNTPQGPADGRADGQILRNTPQGPQGPADGQVLRDRPQGPGTGPVFQVVPDHSAAAPNPNNVALAPNTPTGNGSRGGPTGSGRGAQGLFAVDPDAFKAGQNLLVEAERVIEEIKKAFEPATRLPPNVGGEPIGNAFEQMVPPTVNGFQELLDGLHEGLTGQNDQTGALGKSLQGTNDAATEVASGMKR